MLTATPTEVAPAPAEVHEPQPLSPFPALNAAVSFVRHHPVAIFLASVVVLIPCFWHRHIQAADIGSHLYNAWLAQLIHQGAAPGLHIVPQTSNMLFDLMLSALFHAFGPVAAERIAVSVAVLTFFWGAFALCSAAAESAQWSVTPILAIIAYGFMFNMGFFNLYWSVGFSFFALAILARGRRYDYVLLLPLAALIWMAHLLGTAGLLALGGYLAIARLIRTRWQLVLTTACIGAYFLARWYVLHHLVLLGRESSLYWMLGTDQFIIYAYHYCWISVAVLTIGAIAVSLGLLRGGREALSRTVLWIQIFVIMAIAVAYAPGGVFHPKLGLMGFLPDRASLYSVVLMCCLIAAARPTKWHAAAFSIVALAFFTLLYRDTLKMEQVETNLEKVVATFKPGERVVATIFPMNGSRIHVQHNVDRACIGHCFYIANYEPSSGQFRIKVDPGSPLVTSSQEASIEMQEGRYIVKEQDLPLKEIYQCGPEFSQICVHDLAAGEYNGAAAYAQLDDWIREQRRKAHQ